MRGLDLSAKHQERKKIFLTFYSTIKYNFQIFLEIKPNDHYYSENGCLVFATLHNCLAIFASNHEVVLYSATKRLRNENKDKTKTQMTQSFNQYSENESKIWRQNILNQSCVFVLSSFSFRNLSNERASRKRGPQQIAETHPPG